MTSPSNDDDDTEIRTLSFPKAIRHSLVLKDGGRTLSYYTFATSTSSSVNDNTVIDDKPPHPVLYFHGFPGSGLEGAMCAQQVADAGGQLFAPDRPGFGFSDDSPNNNNKIGDDYVQATCRDLWELVHQLKWNSFSMLGVSGGGPYTLAMLDSYLTKRRQQCCDDDNEDDSSDVPLLPVVSIVAGVCCSAGIDGMMPANQNLFQLVSTTSWWSRFQLQTSFTMPYLLLKVLSPSTMLKFFPVKDLPQVDQDVFVHQDEVATTMMTTFASALRQGPHAAVTEAGVLYRPQQGFESSLKQHYASKNDETHPHVYLFQGLQDVNVPPCHSQYVHKELLGEECSTLTEYQELGHLSLVAEKREDYVGVLMPPFCQQTKP